MSTESVTVQKKKGKKTAEQLVKEYRQLQQREIGLYIDEICRAYKEENPGWTNRDIKNRVYEELSDIHTRSYIENWWPDWIKDPSAVERGKMGRAAQLAHKKWEESREAALNVLSETVKKLPEPPKLVEQPQEEDTEDEELTDTGPLLESHGEPEDNKDVMDFIKEINVAQHDLWKALTRNDTMPHVHEDLVLDHIKPTRKFRKGLVDKTPGMDRAGISRRCGYLVAVLQDMIEIIEESEK